MICKKCGNILPEHAAMCSVCGEPIARQDPSRVGSIRQGSSAAPSAPRISFTRQEPEVNAVPDAPISERRRLRADEGIDTRFVTPGKKPEQDEEATGRKGLIFHQNHRRTYSVRKVMINWSAVAVVILALILAAGVSAFLYLNLTDHGQLILARMGRETSAEALWSYGTELLDQGYIDDSIAIYEKAWKQEPAKEDLYEKLQLLAEAYEAAGRSADAESVFVTMYRDLDKTTSLAYKNIIRLMRSQGRLVEAAAFMKTAYENTGDSYFNRERNEMLPKPPTANLGGGKYSSYKTLELSSSDGFEIYYLFGFGNLPEDGTLYTGPIELKEGYHALHAVCVSSQLVSDELNVNYTVTLPNPVAPYPSLASDTYNSASVRLRNLNDFDVTIYYTIDSTSPTSNSPIYTGEPIKLPGGNSVHLKAVCVDSFGKVSNELDVEYEILQPFKRYFNSGDEFSGFTMMKTNRDAFIRKYGQPIEETEVDDNSNPNVCTRLSYSWGEARFYSSEKGYILYYVETSSPSMTAPRSTRVGIRPEDVIVLFRDMGQPENQDGSRSLYHDDAMGTGMIYKTDENSYRIEYIYFRNDDARMVLCYYADNGKVNRISLKCTY